MSKKNFFSKLCAITLFLSVILQTNAQARVEAETNFTIINSGAPRQEYAGPIASSTYEAGPCSGSAYLSIAVVNDEVSIPLSITNAGYYKVLIRVRSGNGANTTFYTDKYEIKVNGTIAPTSLVAGTISVSDGDSYYGTLTTDALNLNAGTNTIIIKALESWQKVDYIEAESSTAPVLQTAIDVYQLTAEPTIDGIEDAAWASIPWLDINQRDLSDNGGGPRTPDADFGAKVKIAWKNNKLFLFYGVIDNTLFYDPSFNKYDQDNVAIKLNLATTHLTDVNYADTSTWNYQAAINESTDPTGGNVGGRGGKPSAANGWGYPSAQNQFPTSSIVTKSFAGGYNVEIAFDLADALWGLPSALADGITFGFDAGADDVDVAGGFRKQLYWSNLGKGNNSWQDLSGLREATIRANNGYTHYRSKNSGNWSSASSWESSTDGITWIDAFSVPNQLTTDINVATDNLLTIDANATINQLSLAAGAKLSLNTGNTLTANSIILNSDANGTATFVDNNNSNPQAIAATVYQHVAAGRNWYMASPIEAATATLLNRGTRVDTYNEAAKAWTTLNSGDALVAGKGYISVATAVAPGTTGTVNFSGTLNTGNISVPVTRTETGISRGFNLVANPYPSYLDWSAVIADPANVDIVTTMWFRTKNTDGNYTFATHNGTSGLTVTGTSNTDISKLIPPMQAFWIRVKQNAGVSTYGTNLLLKNSMRAHRDITTNTMKAPVLDQRMRLRLTVADKINTDEILLYFDTNAQDAFDDYDSQKMFANPSAELPEIFSVSGTEKLVINGMHNIPLNSEIPIGFVSPKEDNFSIKINEMLNLDADTKIFLKDNDLNKEFDLTDSNAYKFHSGTTTALNNRFGLIFRSQSVTTQNAENIMPAANVQTNSFNQILISSSNNFEYAVYSAIGQKIVSGIGNANKTIVTQAMPKGIYVVKLTMNKKSQSTKIVVQ